MAGSTRMGTVYHVGASCAREVPGVKKVGCVVVLGGLALVLLCSTHAQGVPSVKVVAFQYGFTVMMDFGPYFKDIVEES